MKKLLLIPLLLIITILTSFYFITSINNKSNLIVLNHKYYTNYYDTLLKAEIMGYYIQTKEHTSLSLNKSTALDRKGFASFKQDPLLPEYIQNIVTNNVYSNWNKNNPDKKIDKGHVVPYSAMDFDSTAAYESMYLENTNPQVSMFNEHQWEQVEMYVLKNISPKYGDVKVWTGCLISRSHPTMIYNLYMPDYYWKVIQYVKDGKTVEESWLGSNKFTDPVDTNPNDIISTPQKIKDVISSYYGNELVVNF